MSYNFPGSDIFPDSLTLPDDSTVPNQANFAPGWEGNRNAIIWVRNRLARTALSNFQDGGASGAADNWFAFYYDPSPFTAGGSTFKLANRWRATQKLGSGGMSFFLSADGGRKWSLYATTASASSPLSKCLVADGSFFVHFGASSVVYSGTASVIATSSSGWNATQGVAFRNEATNKEYFVGANQTGTTFTGAAASFTATGPTVVNKTSSLPAGWVSGTNHTGEFFAATNPVNNHTFVAMGGVTPGTDTARILYAAFDVTAPSDVTPALLTGKIITGFSYDVDRKVFVLMTWDGTNTKIYTLDDPNGVGTWTLVVTIPIRFYALFAIHSVWAFAYNASDVTITGTTNALFLTSDMGVTCTRIGVVWSGGGSVAYGGPDSIIVADGTTLGHVYTSLMVR